MQLHVGSRTAGGGQKREVNEMEKEQVCIMVSNFDMLTLPPVPVHPSSSSPTDEHWKQIWGTRALFCRLGDLSESSQACVPVSLPNWCLSGSVSPAGNLCLSSYCFPPSRLFVMQIVFFPPASTSCLFDFLFISNVAAVYLFAECVRICAR